MSIERKIEYLEDEILHLKREGTKISDDTRKAIILDVKEKVQEGKHKSLTLSIGVTAAILSLLGYIGFESVKNEAAQYVVNSEIKQQLLKELSAQKEETDKTLADAKLLLAQIAQEKVNLKNDLSQLMLTIDDKQKSLERVSNVIAKLGVTNKDISSIVSDDFIQVIRDAGVFTFLSSFGVSELSALKLLATETENFNFHKIDKNTIGNSVKQIQERYGLPVDGNMGPCTSLVIGSLLLSNYEVETRKELESSSYESSSWLVKSFQTCAASDKSHLLRLIEYPELPLHVQLNQFITASKIRRDDLLDSLHTSSPLPSAYRALDSIGYEGE